MNAQTFTEACDALAAIVGGDINDTGSGADLLSRARLYHANEVRQLREALEVAERRAAVDSAAVRRLWPLVREAGKRLTMRTADVRGALEGGHFR